MSFCRLIGLGGGTNELTSGILFDRLTSELKTYAETSPSDVVFTNISHESFPLTTGNLTYKGYIMLSLSSRKERSLLFRSKTLEI